MKSTRFSAAGAAIRTLAAAILLALAAASGSGCGQRGPLYLPEAEPGADGQAAAGDAAANADAPGESATDESPDREDSE
jgi:predicted small lipoprotein YifL